ALIRANIHVKEGQPYTRVAVDEDIRNLYASGYFSDIREKEVPSSDGLSITLIYFVEGKPKLTDIVFVGNKKFTTKKLLNRTITRPGVAAIGEQASPLTAGVLGQAAAAGKIKIEKLIGLPLDERSLFAASE